MNQIEEIGNDFMAPVGGGLRFNPGFGGSVEKNNGQRKPYPAKASRKSHEKILPEAKSDFSVSREMKRTDTALPRPFFVAQPLSALLLRK